MIEDQTQAVGDEAPTDEELAQYERMVAQLGAMGLVPGGRRSSQEPQPLPAWLNGGRVGEHRLTEEERFHRRHENKIRRQVKSKTRRRKPHGRH